MGAESDREPWGPGTTDAPGARAAEEAVLSGTGLAGLVGSEDVGMDESAAGSTRDRVRAAWAATLGHDDFTDHDSFFTVGGHSMRGIKLMRRLSGGGIRLPLSLLFEHPTVARLTAALDGRGGTGPAP